MGIINTIRKAFGTVNETTPLPPLLQGANWKRMGGGRIPDNDVYDNLFPYVNALATKFATIEPYAVEAGTSRDDNPVPLTTQPNLFTILNHPNDVFNGMAFREHIAVTLLTQPSVDLLAWTQVDGEPHAGRINPDTLLTLDDIVGLTFLPQGARNMSRNDGSWYYDVQIPDNNGYLYSTTVEREDVLTLTYSRHPNDWTQGISPGMVVKKWASVDDFIADYERGFFGNGAVPAGIMQIVSLDDKDYNTTVNRMESSLRGAINNNKVVYSQKPIDPITQKPSDTSKIEWIPFTNTNNSLDIGTLSDVVGNKLSGAIAIPDIVRGIDNGQTYANAQAAMSAFTDNTLDPLCRKVWGQFQYELERVTGSDLGFDISYHLDKPVQTDVERVRAETNSQNAQTLISLINMGASVDTAVDALELPDTWKQLALTPTPNSQPTPVSIQPPTFNKPVSDTYTFQWKAENKKPRTLEEKLIQAAQQVLAHLAEQGKTRNALALLDEQSNVLSVELLNALQGTVLESMNLTVDELKTLVEAAAENSPELAERLASHPVSHYDTLAAHPATKFKERLDLVSRSYTEDAWKNIQTILTTADSEGWDKQQLTEKLNTYVSSSKAEILARNEIVNAQRAGSVYSAQELANDYKVRLSKEWHTHEGHCDICDQLEGRTIEVDEAFLRVGQSLTLRDGNVITNDFMNMDTTSAHPNCRCYATYKVIGVQDE